MASTETPAATAASENTTGPAETTGAVSSSSMEKPAVPSENTTATTATTAAPGVGAPAIIPEKNETSNTSKTPIQELWALTKENGHPEIWGVQLTDPETHVPTQIVLQKYLNAYDGDLTKSKEQLRKTLEWRAKTKPLELLEKKFNGAKFENLGFVTTFGDASSNDPELKEVFTWNIYGGVKNADETFGQLDDFISWRVALMELALQALSISTATKPITATYDPYKITQVHDYKSISFLRQSPSVKSASQETIKVFATNYPELLKEKFFVNVPVIMGFIYTFMKLFVAAKTIKKFHPMSNGGNLVHEFSDSKVKGLGEMLPKEYGGKGQDLKQIGKEPAIE